MDDLAMTPEALGKAMELLMGPDKREEQLLGDALAYDRLKPDSVKELVEEIDILKRTSELLHVRGTTNA